MDINFPLILDGATGTELQKRGYGGDVCPELWILDHPEAIVDVQQCYVKAGSQVVFAATFTASSVKLEEHKVFNRVDEINKGIVKISRDAFGEGFPVGGDMSAIGKFIAPMGNMTFKEIMDVYKEQAQSLEEAGVDFYIIETMLTMPEMRAALLAVKEVSSKPVFITATCDESGKTLTGSDITAIMVVLQSMGVDAFGLNCSVGPDDMAKQLKRLREYAQVPLIAKPNAGMPEMIDGEYVYGLTPEGFVKHLDEMAEAGVCIFGGCCGTDPRHIAALSEALKTVKMRKPDPQHKDKLVAATEKEVFVLNPDVTYDKVLVCDENIGEAIEDACESGSEIIAIRIEEAAQLDYFAENQFAVSKPLMLICDDAALLEEALMLYQGCALYDGNLGDEVLAPLAAKYGVIY